MIGRIVEFFFSLLGFGAFVAVIYIFVGPYPVGSKLSVGAVLVMGILIVLIPAFTMARFTRREFAYLESKSQPQPEAELVEERAA